jgi:thioredoxin 1
MKFLKYALILFCVGFLTQCGKGQDNVKKEAIPEIAIFDQASAMIENSGDTLLAFDLFADWCGPCRMLAPMLDSIAIENKSCVRFFRINVDKVPQMAQALQVQGIPLVVFFKNKNRIGSVLGMQAREAYEKLTNENCIRK